MNQDVVKGVLILLVMFDHNEYAHQLYPLFLTGFAFHVLGFLALPFLRPSVALSWDYFQKTLIRYYYPFFLIVSAMGVVTMLTVSGFSIESLKRLLLAFYSGNNDSLKTATQMALLWFLPSLISVLLLKALVDGCSPGGKIFLLGAMTIAHLFVGPLAESIRSYLPLGLLPAIYSVPLCYLLAFFNRQCCERLSNVQGALLSSGIFLAVKCLQMKLGLSQELGFALVSDYSNLPALVVNDLESITGALMLFQLSRLRLLDFLGWFGAQTLPTYLIHPFVALVIYKVCEKMLPDAGLMVKFCISMVLTVLLSVGIARVVMHIGVVRRFCFPKDVNTLVGRI
ncbi:hypothetical protein [Herbaspirillum sp. NPDC087042]|uniref:hypothetical protein n=1 Tax=Herbaspirillum sp. NPDC087042 TaxID=3364004 RepID=UPI003826177D